MAKGFLNNYSNLSIAVISELDPNLAEIDGRLFVGDICSPKLIPFVKEAVGK